MTGQLTVTHTHGDRISVRSGDVDILDYVYRPDPDPFESRKPYAHPLRTLAGHQVTGYRPHDHRWHKGLQMTASHLSGQNFWGGHSYIQGKGYLPLPERVGSMRHDAFTRIDADTDDRLALTERLTWCAGDGAEWAREERSLTVHSIEPAEGAWALDWTLHLQNIRDSALSFGSPTTAGRENAGYTGLNWRGPRDFTGGQVLTPSGPASDTEAMGTAVAEAPWLAFTAARDEVDAHSTLVFAHAPENESGIHRSHWFVRAEPVPAVALSWAFFEEFALPPGEAFSYRYRVVVADGAWDVGRVERYLESHPW